MELLAILGATPVVAALAAGYFAYLAFRITTVPLVVSVAFALLL